MWGGGAEAAPPSPRRPRRLGADWKGRAAPRSADGPRLSPHRRAGVNVSPGAENSPCQARPQRPAIVDDYVKSLLEIQKRKAGSQSSACPCCRPRPGPGAGGRKEGRPPVGPRVGPGPGPPQRGPWGPRVQATALPGSVRCPLWPVPRSAPPSSPGPRSGPVGARCFSPPPGPPPTPQARLLHAPAGPPPRPRRPRRPVRAAACRGAGSRSSAACRRPSDEARLWLLQPAEPLEVSLPPFVPSAPSPLRIRGISFSSQRRPPPAFLEPAISAPRFPSLVLRAPLCSGPRHGPVPRNPASLCFCHDPPLRLPFLFHFCFFKYSDVSKESSTPVTATSAAPAALIPWRCGF